MIATAVTLSVMVAVTSACTAAGPASTSNGATDQPASSAAEAVTLSDEDIRRAEDSVKNALPDAPIWEGMTFSGVIVNETSVCVDRTYRAGGGLDGKGGSAGYVIVTFPGLTLGEPQDGKCEDVADTPAGSSEPVQVPEDVRDNPGLVTRDDFGDIWPLVVDYAVLSCEPLQAGGMELQIATLQSPDKTVYALNGTAKQHTDAADLAPIWANDPSAAGLKISVGPLIERALSLCGP